MTTSLDDKTRALILATVPVLKKHGVTLTQEMYKRLLSDPEIRDLFNLSHQRDGEQPKALFYAVLAYAEHINDLGALGNMVERIAEKHVGLNILPKHYPYVGKALLAAIKHVLGDAVTPEIYEAWEKAYWFLADLLINREEQIYVEHEETRGGWRGWRPLRVRSRRQETQNIVSFELVAADDGPIAKHRAGQYLSFKIDVPDHGWQRRNYSISSVPGADHYRITVRLVEGGLVSPWLHKSVHEGNILQVANPAGDFFLNEKHAGPVVLLTAGVGITPALSMQAALAQAGQHSVRFVHGARKSEEIPLLHHLKEQAEKGHMQADFFVSQGGCLSHAEKGITCHEGQISPQWLRETLNREAIYYICGPVPFMHEMVRTLREEKMPAHQIRYEFFGSASDPDLVL